MAAPQLRWFPGDSQALGSIHPLAGNGEWNCASVGWRILAARSAALSNGCWCLTNSWHMPTPPPHRFFQAWLEATPGTPGFAIDLLHDPLQAHILLAHITAVGNVGYFLLRFSPPPHPTVKKSKLCSFLISYIFLNLSDSEVVPWVCSQWKFLLCLALEVWPLPGKQHISWFIEWSIWIWA